MSADVPILRPHIRSSLISTGAYVRSGTWLDAAGLANYLRGLGQVLVPRCLVNETITASGNATYRFRCRPSIFPHRRRWSLHLHGASSPGVATVNVPSGGSSQTVGFSNSRQESCVPVTVYEDVTSPSASETELTIKITAPSTTNLDVIALACTEVPRSTITIGGSELGVDLLGESPGQPIEADLADMSLGAIVKALNDTTYGAANSQRRVILQWARAAGKVFSTTSYVNVYSTGGEAIALAQKLRSSDASSTTRTINFRVYATTSDGTTTASVQATAGHGGATGTVSGITNTLKWWPDTSGAAATLAIDREDLTAIDGRQSTTWDSIQWAGKRTAGAGTLTVYAASFWTDLV